jgi:hypothetical protein
MNVERIQRNQSESSHYNHVSLALRRLNEY